MSCNQTHTNHFVIPFDEQVLDLSHNSISDLPQFIFKPNVDLRIVDLSHNYLRSLPDGLFAGSGMESYVQSTCIYGAIRN